MIEMRQIQVFLAISEHLNFSRAAEKIYLTQPTVSGHLKTLENYLKVQLVDRDSREVRLTPAGKIFLPYARRIFSLQEKARKEMLLYAGAKRGALEIGGSNTPGQYILPAIIGQLSDQHDQVRIKLNIGDSDSIIDMVGDGALEIGLVGNPAPGSELVSEKCSGDRLILIANPRTAATISAPVGLDKLKKLPLIMRSQGSGTRKNMLTALKSRGLNRLDELNLVAEMGSAEAVRQAVRGNLGLAIISNLCVADDLQNGTLAEVEMAAGPIERDFYLVYSREHRLSPLARLLKEELLGFEPAQ